MVLILALFTVALHPEGVDRNGKAVVLAHLPREVALHPEGVDRNMKNVENTWNAIVALHPEGVDRNAFDRTKLHNQEESPSTRRAWIEILFDEGIYNAFGVALHPEGVDRNHNPK